MKKHEYFTPTLRRTRLMLIGIDEYQHWKKLKYPVGECDKFFQLLKQHYGFNEHDLIQSLYNEEATAEIIFDELYRLQELDEDGLPFLSTYDNLILYFSGHGHLDKGLDEGYWVPVDAPVPNKIRPSDLRKLVSVSEVVKILSRVKAHHIVLIVDACFSGAFYRMEIDVTPSDNHNNPEEKPSRWVLTAGRLETVPDKSIFAEALLQVLVDNAEPRISIDWVGAEVMKRVGKIGKQNPWCGTLVDKKHEGGEFFFNRISAAIQRIEQPIGPSFSIDKLPKLLRKGTTAHLARMKKGRFKFLHIEKLLLTGTNLPDFIETQVVLQQQETPLQMAVQSLWGCDKPHAVVLGEGGMGKTVSLVRLWEDLLQLYQPIQQQSTPIFIALNEYNALPEIEKHDFVLRSIVRNCGLTEVLCDEWKSTLWEVLKTPLLDGSPAILLLLDGFNEITVKKDQLLIDLNYLADQAKGVQMVITSRYVEIRNFTWAQHSEIVELLPLSHLRIEEYLQQVKLPLPTNEHLRKLFTNPMMLTLYAGSSSIAQKYKDDSRFRFLPTGSYGELLWNFNEAQLAKYLEDCEHDLEEQIWHIFLLRCLVPWLAYSMEKEGQFFLANRKVLNPAFNFKTLLAKAFTSLNCEELTELLPILEGRRSLLGLTVSTDVDTLERRSLKVRQYLVDKMHLLVSEEEVLRFVHQNFRDFFAACHLRNVVEMALVKGELPDEWKERAFPIYLRRMIGEIEGEHYFSAQKLLKVKLLPGFLNNNILSRLLEKCRGVLVPKDLTNLNDSDSKVGFSVWNVLSTWDDLRSTLVGADLTRLDLRKFLFNGKSLNIRNGAIHKSVCFSGSIIDGKQLIFEGHTSEINSVCYSPDGKKILSASEDETIKEWSVETGICLQTFKGHGSRVNCARYSPDGKKIISASSDKTVKEWSVESGECLQTLEGHGSRVNSAGYSSDGSKIISASDNDETWKELPENFNAKYFLENLIISGTGTVKEWSVETGSCIRTFGGLGYSIRMASYSPDGMKVITIAPDCTIIEWSEESGVCLSTFEGGHYSMEVPNACYSPDGTKVLSTWGDSTIKERLLETGACLLTYKGHYNRGVHRACYSPDGKKVLLWTADATIEEWSARTGVWLQTFQGNNYSVKSFCYSPDGKRVLAALSGIKIKEWSVETGLELQTFQGHNTEFWKIYYDGKKMLTNMDGFFLMVWSNETGICVQTKQKNSTKAIHSYSPDMKRLLTVTDGKVEEWLLETGARLQIINLNSLNVRVCYSPDGKRILTESDGKIEEWLLETGTRLLTINLNSSNVRVCYSPDGKKILAESGGKIEEWLLETVARLQTINIQTNNYNNWSTKTIYSPDGKRILIVSDKKVEEWLLETGIRLQTINLSSYRDICYSPDGKKVLLTSNEKVEEWLLETGTCLQTIKLGVFKSACYSPDGKKVLLQINHNTIEEWSMETRERLQIYVNDVGLLLQSADFRHLHPDSHFTELENERLRRYGAILSDNDEHRWKKAIADTQDDWGGDFWKEFPEMKYRIPLSLTSSLELSTDPQ